MGARLSGFRAFTALGFFGVRFRALRSGVHGFTATTVYEPVHRIGACVSHCESSWELVRADKSTWTGVYSQLLFEVTLFIARIAKSYEPLIKGILPEWGPYSHKQQHRYVIYAHT